MQQALLDTVAQLTAECIWKASTRSVQSQRGNKAHVAVWTHLQIVEVHGIVNGFPSDLAKDGVLAVQVVASIQRYKELAAVGVWRASICACHETPVVYIYAHPPSGFKTERV